MPKLPPANTSDATPETADEERVIKARSVRLDDYYASDNYRHLDMFVADLSIAAPSFGLESWPAVKFKFCLEDKTSLLEFREAEGWPTIFIEFPGEERDQYGLLARLWANEIDRVADWPFRRDKMLVQAVSALLQHFVAMASEQAGVTADERELWLSGARRFAESSVRGLRIDDEFYKLRAFCRGPREFERADRIGTVSTGQASGFLPAARVFEHIVGVPASGGNGQQIDVGPELTAVLQKISFLLGDQAALGLLYAHVLRRSIDSDSVATRLQRLALGASDWKSIVTETLQSQEAKSLHAATNYSLLRRIDLLRGWLDASLASAEVFQ